MERNPNASDYDLESLKDYVKQLAFGIKPQKNRTDICPEADEEPKACLSTVRQYWKDFTGGWNRDHSDQIPPVIIRSVTNVSYRGYYSPHLALSNIDSSSSVATWLTASSSLQTRE